MKQIKYLFLLLISTTTGCYYGVNEKTSEIARLNDFCLKKGARDSIASKYSIKEVKDSVFVSAISDMNNQPFPVSIIYFSEGPKELLGLGHYPCVRYVFNPLISDQTLDGLSSELNEKEKKRIRNRVQKILMKYQCEDGKKESEILMAE